MDQMSMLLMWMMSVGLFALKMFITGFALVGGAAVAMKTFLYIKQ